AGDDAQPLPGPPGPAGDPQPAAPRLPSVDRSGAGARRARWYPEGGEPGGRDGLPSRRGGHIEQGLLPQQGEEHAFRRVEAAWPPDSNVPRRPADARLLAFRGEETR